ncbi:ATP-binding protein [Actinotalea sp. AC32]|nr:ATP-binding protein [Actinotalea sp. AC32]
MGIHAPEVHVLLQDLDGGGARWWLERGGPEPSRTVMTLRTPPRRGAVWVARHWTTDRAAESGVAPSRLPDIALLTSELVGNAVVHGSGGEVEVRFSVDPERVTVAVSDANLDPPEVRRTGPATPGGQGMRLVELLATSWGHHRLPQRRGKTVWFAIAL